MSKFKKCYKCGKTLNIQHFNKNKSKSDGLSSECKRCIKARDENDFTKRFKDFKAQLKRFYKITVTQYIDMCFKQNFKCAICGKHYKENKRALYVDHCHETGKIRGLLCHKCNSGLGAFQDSLEIVEKVVKYLKEEY